MFIYLLVLVWGGGGGGIRLTVCQWISSRLSFCVFLSRHMSSEWARVVHCLVIFEVEFLFIISLSRNGRVKQMFWGQVRVGWVLYIFCLARYWLAFLGGEVRINYP